MKTLLQGGSIVTASGVTRADLLIDGEKIAAIGTGLCADGAQTVDVSGRLLFPGFIDGHMHIESTMLLPAELARVSVPHGTTAIVADPHEIANVCGVSGVSFMLDASEGLPMTVYLMLPSCVPATPFDESRADGRTWAAAAPRPAPRPGWKSPHSRP